MKLLIISCLLIVALSSSCDIVKNDLPLMTQQPTLVKTVQNGQKYIIGNPQDKNSSFLYIANLKGTYKQMGQAFGKMFKEEIVDLIDHTFYDYYAAQLQQLLEKKLPKFMAEKVSGGVKGLLKRILDLNYKITKKYTNSRYYEEIDGIGKGTGSKKLAKQIKRVNLFPELIKAACTLAGVWNQATGGNTLHLRALDWDAKNPISKYPTVIVYHPTQKGMKVHANFAWAGFVGSLTGMSELLSIGEKVWIPPKHSVKTTRYGNPWTYVIRDVLYESTNLTQAIAKLTSTHRTCSIHLGIASATDKSFRMFEYAEKTLNNYDDKNYTHFDNKKVPQAKKKGIAFFDKHVQPSTNTCVGDILNHPSYYGKWTAEELFRVVGKSHETGDTQLAVFDLTEQTVILSYSSPVDATKAFHRTPMKIDMKKLFASF